MESLSASVGLVLSGVAIPLVAAAEVALAASSRRRLRQLRDQGFAQAERLEPLLQEPSRFLSSLMLLKTAAYVVAGASAMALGAARGWPFTTGLLVTGAVWWTLVSVQIGVRAYALRDPEGMALRVAAAVACLVAALTPLAAVVQALARRILGQAREETPSESVFLSEDGLRLLLRVREEESLLEDAEKAMIAGIVEMGETHVREVMVPRLDVVALPAEATLDEALALVQKYGYSRIPVYEGDIDHVIGLLYAKDLLGHLRAEELDTSVRLLVRPAYFVPESKRLDELFREMQARRIHMAVVVDEYGGTAGIVTIEDLLEEIVGEIRDEYDVETPDVQVLPGRTYICSGRLDLDELAELIQVDFGPYLEEVDTLGGFLYAQFGRIPEPGESVEFQGWRFTVLSVDSRRIDQVRVEPLATALETSQALETGDEESPAQRRRPSDLLGNTA